MPVRAFLLRLRSQFRQSALDRQLEEELRFHLGMEAEANKKRGMSSEDAWLAAQRTFGGTQQIKEIYRERRGLPMIEAALKDLQYAFRTIRMSPGFTAIVVISLALGIGANTAIFTLIDAVMLRLLPCVAANRAFAWRTDAECVLLSALSTPEGREPRFHRTPGVWSSGTS